MIGRLEYVELREVWRHEAADFTVWLAENIDFLNDALQVNLNVIETEKQIGSFNVDIFCEDSQGAHAIIENQLEKTDHTHLGQLLTYSVGVDAKTIVWVTSHPRQEHIRVVEWLNEITPADMGWYLVKIEAVRINGSPVAPLFTQIVGPSEDTKETGTAKKDLADRHIRRINFWEGLLQVLNQRTPLFKRVGASKDNWLAGGSGVGGIYYQIIIRKTSVSLQVVIEKDREGPLNKKVFDYFYEHREEISTEFGHEINWRRLDDKISSRIQHDIDQYGLDDEETWQEGYQVIADRLVKWEKAFQPYITKVSERRYFSS